MNLLLYPYDKKKLTDHILLVVNLDIKDLNQKSEEIFQDGFKYPIITTKIGSYIFDSPKLVFTWNKDNNQESILAQKKMLTMTLKNVIRSLKVNQSKCNIKIKLTKHAIEYLYQYTKHILFEFKNKKEQREISGSFKITKYTSEYIELDINQMNVGEIESASYINEFGTFHTHPYEAYKKYNVCIAWPSADDYISFLYMYGSCCCGFHIVSTLEGLYIISLKKYIPPEKIIKNFKKIKDNIEYHHGVDYPETDNQCDIEKNKIKYQTIYQYVKRINRKGKFNLVFVKWKDCEKVISLKYAPIKNNCFITTEQGKLYKQLE